MSRIDCVIIGAGPAGLAAGLASLRAGRSVVILEKNDRPGRKLLITGGGRCNLTDPARSALDELEQFGRTGAFLRDALANFSLADFLAALGVETELDASDGRHYVKGGAVKLLASMLAELERAHVQIVPCRKVTRLKKDPKGGFVVETEKGEFRAGRVVVATGGVTYPTTGSSGDGYAWASALGHEVDPPRAALGAVQTNPSFGQFAGNTVADAELTLKMGKRKAAERRGALLFTHRGVSGPAAVDLSLDLARAQAKKDEPAEILIDFLPDVSRGELESCIRKHPSRRISRAFEDAPFAKALPAKLFADIIRRAGIDPAAFVSGVSPKLVIALVDALKAMRVAVVGLEDPDSGIVTFGGVSTKEIDPKTMESRLVAGLFFAGEIVSVHGPCGGFNLLQAFATGWLAGS